MRRLGLFRAKEWQLISCAPAYITPAPTSPDRSRDTTASMLVFHEIPLRRREPVQLVQCLVQSTLVGLDCRDLFGQGSHAFDELRRPRAPRRAPAGAAGLLRIVWPRVPVRSEAASANTLRPGGRHSRRDRSCPTRRRRSCRVEARPNGSAPHAGRRGRAPLAALPRAPPPSRRDAPRPSGADHWWHDPAPWARARTFPAGSAGRAKASRPDGAPVPARRADRRPVAEGARRCVHLSWSRRARAETSARSFADACGTGKGAMNCRLASYQPPCFGLPMRRKTKSDTGPFKTPSRNESSSGRVVRMPLTRTLLRNLVP